MPAAPLPPTHGLILFAHGARDPAWAQPFEALAARVREGAVDHHRNGADAPGAVIVRLAYLELMAPSLPAAAAELVGLGCASIAIVPLFLGVGSHLRHDLPRLVERLRAAHPALTLTLAPALLESDPLLDAITAHALDALGAAEGGR